MIKFTPEIKAYGRSLAEFKEMFKYGKMYMVLKVNGQYAEMHRMYLLKDGDTFKLQPKANPVKLTGAPGFQFQNKDLIFYSTDGVPSILRLNP